MRVERLTVDEGFLARLDIQFVPGLNVLIGERGTGKTSVIELLRFAGAGWFTEDARTRGHQQALSVLGDGKVSVTLFDGVERFTVTRTAQDDRPQSDGSAVTVLAQNEIEALGVQPAGRLRLIDRFRENRNAEEGAPSVVAQLRSMTAEIQGLVSEVITLDERCADLRTVPAELDEALQRQTELLTSIAATEDQRTQLGSLQTRHTELSLRDQFFEATQQRLRDYLAVAQSLDRTGFQLDEWPATAGDEDAVQPIRASLGQLASNVSEVVAGLGDAMASLADLQVVNAGSRQAVEEEARNLRVVLNRLQEGAGAITKQVDELRERKGQLDALTEMRSARTSRMQQLIEERDAVYDRLDHLRDERYAARAAVAEYLVSKLVPTFASQSAGRTSSAGTCRSSSTRYGSGLHYNRLAPVLARELTPLELVRAAESLAVDAVCAATDLPPDRALAMLTHLRTSSLADVIVAPIDDGVTLELLDGVEYKSTDRLSIGQRCTVILPMLLAADGATLVVDQPEDHLDNAYVTTTLVERLRSRAPESTALLFLAQSEHSGSRRRGPSDRDGLRRQPGFQVAPGQA